jgi:hypothetical protein
METAAPATKADTCIGGVSLRQPTRQQAVAAGGVIKTTDKAKSGGDKYPSTTGDGVLHSCKPTVAAPLLQTDGGGKHPLTTGDGVHHSCKPTAAAPLLQEYGGGTGDPWLPAVSTILEEEIGDGGKGGPW